MPAAPAAAEDTRPVIAIAVDQSVRSGQLRALAEVAAVDVDLAFLVILDEGSQTSWLEKLAYEKAHSSVLQLMLPDDKERPTDALFSDFMDYDGRELFDTPRDEDGNVDVAAIASELTALAPKKPLKPPVVPTIKTPGDKPAGSEKNEAPVDAKKADDSKPADSKTEKKSDSKPAEEKKSDNKPKS